MILILMGVSGAGKTTIGERLSVDLGWPFLDGDALHPPENIAKMSRGMPLTDEDRKPWLHSIRAKIDQFQQNGQSAIIACSALKKRYRVILKGNDDEIVFVYLKGSPRLIQSRLESRRGHFMNPDLLLSQMEALEEPFDAIIVEVDGTPEQIVKEIRIAIGV